MLYDVRSDHFQSFLFDAARYEARIRKGTAGFNREMTLNYRLYS